MRNIEASCPDHYFHLYFPGTPHQEKTPWGKRFRRRSSSLPEGCGISWGFYTFQSLCLNACVDLFRVLQYAYLRRAVDRFSMVLSLACVYLVYQSTTTHPLQNLNKISNSNT